MHDIVKLAQIKYYEEEIGRLLCRRVVLLMENDEFNALLLEEKIKELIQKMEELK